LRCWSWKTSRRQQPRGQVLGIACPLGAHYLPVPGDDAREVQDLLEELGLRRRVAGRWQYDERHLCHSPQERLFFNGEWQDGLLPVQGVGAATLAQYRGLRRRWRGCSARRALRFRRFAPLHAATRLRWTHDVCRVAGRRRPGRPAPALVPGLLLPRRLRRRHRHGVGLGGRALLCQPPWLSGAGRVGDARRDAVLTWPKATAGSPGAGRAAGRRGCTPAAHHCALPRPPRREVDAFDHATRPLERWQARQCIVALPVLVAARVVQTRQPCCARERRRHAVRALAGGQHSPARAAA
jgi:hypothetical protein